MPNSTLKTMDSTLNGILNSTLDGTLDGTLNSMLNSALSDRSGKGRGLLREQISIYQCC